MYSKILILRFPKTEVEKPIVCYLSKDFDLTFNILNASILPRKEGVMVLARLILRLANQEEMIAEHHSLDDIISHLEKTGMRKTLEIQKKWHPHSTR